MLAVVLVVAVVDHPPTGLRIPRLAQHGKARVRKIGGKGGRRDGLDWQLPELRCRIDAGEAADEVAALEEAGHLREEGQQVSPAAGVVEGRVGPDRSGGQDEELNELPQPREIPIKQAAVTAKGPEHHLTPIPIGPCRPPYVRRPHRMT